MQTQSKKKKKIQMSRFINTELKSHSELDSESEAESEFDTVN